MSEPLVCAALYWPAASGPYLWHAFDAAQVVVDMGRLRSAGLRTVRVPLAWDAFVVSDHQVSPHRMRDLETLLVAAQAESVDVIPVLFVQSFGGCVMMPAFAVDRKRPRRGVRVLTDGVVQPGGPRDPYDDLLMLEMQAMWLDRLLDAFAGHAAVRAWDLGHDPAGTVRPRRIAHLQTWVRLLSERVHARGSRCHLTLGAGDVLTARGVRPAAVAPYLDALGLVALPQRLPALSGAVTDPGRVVLTAQLALRLAAAGADAAVPPLHVETGVTVDLGAVGGGEGEPAAGAPGAARGEGEPVAPLAPDEAVRHTGAVLERLADIGAGGVVAHAWSDVSARLLTAPPFDRAPWLAHLGIVDVRGERKPHGEVWAATAAAEPERHPSIPWPPALDVEAYYAELPDSARDLQSQWAGDDDQDGA